MPLCIVLIFLHSHYIHLQNLLASQTAGSRSFPVKTLEPVHEFSNNVVCTTSKVSGRPAHTRSPIRAFASRLRIP